MLLEIGALVPWLINQHARSRIRIRRMVLACRARSTLLPMLTDKDQLRGSVEVEIEVEMEDIFDVACVRGWVARYFVDVAAIDESNE